MNAGQLAVAQNIDFAIQRLSISGLIRFFQLLRPIGLLLALLVCSGTGSTTVAPFEKRDPRPRGAFRRVLCSLLDVLLGLLNGFPDTRA